MKKIKKYMCMDQNPDTNQIGPSKTPSPQNFNTHFEEALKSLSKETLCIEKAISELTDNPESKNDYEKITDAFFMDFLPDNLFGDSNTHQVSVTDRVPDNNNISPRVFAENSSVQNLLPSKNAKKEKTYSKFNPLTNGGAFGEDSLRPDVNHVIRENFSKYPKKREGGCGGALGKNAKRLPSKSNVSDALDMFGNRGSMDTENTHELPQFQKIISKDGE